MAANQENLKLSNFQSYLEYFEYYIHDIVSKMFGNTVGESRFTNSGEISQQNICVLLNTARSRSRRNSDIIIKTNRSLEEVTLLHTEICQCQAIKKYLASSYIDQYRNMHIVLDRKIFIKDIFDMVIAQGINYGQKREPLQCNVLINCSSINDELTVGKLRNVLLCNHMAQVLRQNRWKIDMHCPCYGEVAKNLKDVEVEYFGISNLTSMRQNAKCCSEELGSILWDNVLKSPYATTDYLDKEPRNIDSHNALNNTSAGERKNNALSTQNGLLDDISKTRTKLLKNISFNMTKYIEDLRTSEKNTGNSFHSFYKTVKNINVSSVWDDVLYLEMFKHSNTKVIHVCGQEKLVYWQKVALTWRSLTPQENSVADNQMFLCHAGCLSNSNIPVCELLRVRTKQVKHSYIMKYGASVNDKSWTEIITKMAVSVIKLEILLVPLNSQAKVDVTESGDFPAICRQALFVLYNCARLSKILEKYNSEVDKGTYPALPDVSVVDFSLLKDQIEWDLVLKYVANYPVILNNITKCVNDSSIMIKFSSNKIAQFLVSLSQDISSYYSRVHVLVESREHLNSVMFARLYLVKTLFQVIENGMQLLNIEAIHQM